MTDAFFERLRDDLRPKYELLREIKSGGMGTVYLAEHTHLHQHVAIKVIRAGLDNARLVERFRREAQALASLQHPNVVRVYDADTSRSGIDYFVMEYLEGETLEARLERERPLSGDAAVDLALPLFDALGKVHQAGIVHRDIKPGNIMLVDGGRRPILIDFGVAKADRAENETLTEFRERVGTLRYMAPEQMEGKEVTHRADLYSLGVVLYEAVTPPGVEWPWMGSEEVDWSSVPASLRGAIQTAVQSRAQARWPDAQAFASALMERREVPAPAATPGRAMILKGLLAGTAVLVVIKILIEIFGAHGPPPLTPDLAILPFSPASGSSGGSDLAYRLAYSVGLDLQELPLVRLVDPVQSFRCARSSVNPVNTGRWRQECGKPARYRVEGTVSGQRDSLQEQVRIFDAEDALTNVSDFLGSADSIQLFADRITVTIMKAVASHIKNFPMIDVPTIEQRPNLLALNEFMKGDSAFVINEWVNADRYYQNALRLDSTRALAAWRLAVVRAWMRVPVEIDLHRVYQRDSAQLTPSIRLQLRATLEPIGPHRVALLDSAAVGSPFDAAARLQYGDELWGRGPLVGIGLDSAARVLDAATKLVPKLLPAYADLIWIYVRLGNQELAKRALDTLVASAPAPEATGIDIPGLFRIIYYGRFPAGPTPAAPVDTAGLERSMRFGLAIDIPETQLRFGSLFAALPGSAGANGHETAGLALIALGRGREALAQFDSAAPLFATPASRIEAAEWRALPGAFGWPLMPSEEALRGERDLEGWTTDVTLGGRASWDLAWLATRRGDTITAGKWRSRLGARATDADTRELLALLDAGRLALRGDPVGALALTQPLLTASLESRTRYPFLRAALHLARAEWLEREGDPAAAEREWLWYENNDATEWPSGPAQAGDVDWALANYARLQRTRVALAIARGQAGVARACWHLTRVRQLWTGADSASRALLDTARAHAPGCPR